jgi:EAL domain-containing protein (putative c-di-GMP-specific phosphodiesterase class I)
MLPSHVVFEITETAAVSDFSAARAFMNAVRELGCAFSLDDFGVGFSSFNYVKQLPVDYVKIDGSFVRTLVDSPDDQVFVRALPRWRAALARRRWPSSLKTNAP